MYVEFHAPADVHIPQAARKIAAFVASFPTPVESVLADPQTLLQDPDRLAALIHALGKRRRETAGYRELLATLR
jgi:hypothetical protein